MQKILTISIAAYNAENDIARCLDSLVNSGVIEKLDIIIVNDGSKDHTSEIANKYVEKYKESIRLINKENGGHGSTINTSIQLATGKYYKILDSDDWFDTNNLSKFVEYLETNDADLVLNPYHEVSYANHSSRKLVIYAKKDLEYEKVYDISCLSEDTILFMHSLTYNASIIRRMGSIIDEHCFYVDMEYCVFPMLYVKTFAYLNYSIYQYLLGSQTQSMDMNNMIRRREQHLKVLRRLIRFYNEKELEFITSIKSVVQLRIKYAVYQQYKIYFSMDEPKAINEVIEFDQWLKHNNGIFYSGVDGRFMKIIDFNRKTRFMMFPLFTRLLKDKL